MTSVLDQPLVAEYGIYIGIQAQGAIDVARAYQQHFER